MSRGNHRKAVTGATIAVVAAAGAGIFAAQPASATTGWEQLRQCESGGNYSINTGNGFYGAYQFDLQTWQSVGGTGLPSDTSPAEQDMRAEMLYAQRGASPWPNCGRFLSGAASVPQEPVVVVAPPSVDEPAPDPVIVPEQRTPGPDAVQAAPTSTPEHRQWVSKGGSEIPAATTGGSYTVVAGDTLSAIAAAHGISWHDLYANNAGVVGGNANLIYPGQVLSF